ncbi:hypothetical protein BN59_02698 [Legionella massiliensis]|uniref:Uncharacterized protein n=1 Tax=Legionella massiliensis TaxID=1034943 RepID=A0A078L328_9GAMM|nr:hypothetical protein [Legionella massiliensis]CDZ78388.1 hypothetical protein BN59_02698 [Legionella massiliensis]CEE14126.1 hypothetical protein BN1094_02698 [Legionella massiliensis]
MRYSDFRKMLQTIVAVQLNDNQCPQPLVVLKELLQTYLARLPKGQTLFAPEIREILVFKAQLTDKTSLEELFKLIEDYYRSQDNPRKPNALKACLMAFFHYYRFSFDKKLLLESEVIAKYILLPLSLHSRDKRDSVINAWLDTQGMFNIGRFIIPETSRKAVMDRLGEELEDIRSLQGTFPTLSDTEQEAIIKALITKCETGKNKDSNYIYRSILSEIRIPTRCLETVAQHLLKTLRDHKEVKYIDKVLFRQDILAIVREELIQFLLDELDSRDHERLNSAVRLLTQLRSKSPLLPIEVHAKLQEKCLALLQTYKELEPSELIAQADSATNLFLLMEKLNFSEPQSQEIVSTLFTMLSIDSPVLKAYALRLLAASMQGRLLSSERCQLLIDLYSIEPNGSVSQALGKVLVSAIIPDGMSKELLAVLIKSLEEFEIGYSPAKVLNNFLSLTRNTKLKLDFLEEWIACLQSEDQSLRAKACTIIEDMVDIPASLTQPLLDIAENELYPDAQDAAREALTRITTVPNELRPSVYHAVVIDQAGIPLSTLSRLVIPKNSHPFVIKYCMEQIIRGIKARHFSSNTEDGWSIFTQIANTTRDENVQKEIVGALFKIIGFFDLSSTLDALSCLSSIQPLSIQLRYDTIFALLKLIEHSCDDPKLSKLLESRLLLEHQLEALNMSLLQCKDPAMHAFVLASLERIQASLEQNSELWFELETFIQGIEVEMPILPEMFRLLPDEVNERIIASPSGA